jgi:putative DNA primase/helicase
MTETAIDTQPEAFTDLGYAARFAEVNEGGLIHVEGRGWLAYDGGCWRPDHKQAVRHGKALAEATVIDMLATLDTKAIGRAVKRCSESAIRAALKLAESDERVSVDASRLDAHKDLLCVGNGVVDLRDGALFDHAPELLLTKQAGADYDPSARSERWERFLADTTGGDEELSSYLQRAAGYSATGHAREEVVLFVYGPGGSGKTTLAEAIRTALGDHAATVAWATFLSGRNDGSTASPDVADLDGVRVAIASEVNAGQRFNTARLKALTGGERIVARRLYQDPISFVPAFVAWLIGNDAPELPASDSAAFRRMRVVPLDRVVPAALRDPALKDALTNDLGDRAAVLAWIVAGAVAWYSDGLGSCAAIDAATERYRLANDSIALWLATACRLDADASTPASELRDHYEHWCAEAGAEPVTAHPYLLALEGHGLRRRRTKTGYVWQGIHIAGVPSASSAPLSEKVLTRARMGDSSETGALGSLGTPDAPEADAPEAER